MESSTGYEQSKSNPHIMKRCRELGRKYEDLSPSEIIKMKQAMESNEF